MNHSQYESNPYSFAVWVAKQLTQAGHQALFAGGCVRDKILGVQPKDYDVATSAVPAEVQAIFGRKRTIAIGAAFGVISVIGNSETGNVEIATFRADGEYADGRRPDHVTFTDAKNDALRRDFTINGLFYDPIQESILDYVDGQQDLQRQVIRAIGNPVDRFNEDKLRMLHAVRFATTLGFEIEPETMQAIQNHATEIDKVSGERILAEMNRLLASPRRGQGLLLLRHSRLESVILPLATDLKLTSLEKVCRALDHRPMHHANLEISIAALLFVGCIDDVGLDEFLKPDSHARLKPLHKQLQQLIDHWHLSNVSKGILKEAIVNVGFLIGADSLAWSQLQPKLICPYSKEVLAVASLVVEQYAIDPSGIQRCLACLELPVQQLNPAPLLSGDQLMEMGVPKGPKLGQCLQQLRRQQLDQPHFTAQDAIAWVQTQVQKI